MKPPRSSLTILWIIIGVLFWMLLFLPVPLAMLPIWDGPPVDDSDMQIVHREIPDERNAFPLFRQASESLVPFPRNHPTSDKWHDQPGAHRDDILEHLAANNDTLQLIRQGLALGDYQTPEVKRVDDLAPWVSDALAFGNLLRLKHRVETDPGVRFDLLMMQLQFADLNYRAGSSLIEALVGIALHGQAFGSCFDTLWDPDTDSEKLQRLLTRLGEIRVDEERMVRALQAEYRLLTLIIQEVMRGSAVADDLVDFEDLPGFSRPFIRPGTWGYQEENTKRLYLQYIRQPIAYLRGEVDFEQVGVLPMEIEEFFEGKGSLFRKTHNMIGKLLLAIMVPSVDATLNRYKEVVADHHAALLITALQLRAREHGSLPDTLDALVPAYLDEVPADPFDGQPFRYLPEQARIYSIGTNRVDNGGSIRLRPGRRDHSRNDSEDRVYGIFEKVEWGEEEG